MLAGGSRDRRPPVVARLRTFDFPLSTFDSPATYLVGPHGPEYRRQVDDVRWYCYDGLGSVLAEVTPAGVMTASRTYDVYGLARSSNGTSTSKHKFVGSLGHTSEDDTGLVYMRARWVDPAVGRFVSEDPARDGVNWFEYCRGNPVNGVDPTGKSPLLIIGGIIALAGIVGGIMECLAYGWSWQTFLRGFLVAAVTVAGGLFGGPAGGFLAGAVMGALESVMTGGDPVAGALVGGACGSVGGLSEGVSAIMAGITKRELAALLLLSFDEGMLQGDAALLQGSGKRW